MVEHFLSFLCLCVHVLYFICNLVMLETHYVRISASHIYFYLVLVFISSFIWSRFIFDLYLCVYICVIFCVYILFCNRTPWKNSLTEWSTLYKYFLNKIINTLKTTQDTNTRNVCMILRMHFSLTKQSLDQQTEYPLKLYEFPFVNNGNTAVI